MIEPARAVFLSYASQDAEAARRIADTLRAAGVEVWFDRSKLGGRRCLGPKDSPPDTGLRALPPNHLVPFTGEDEMFSSSGGWRINART